MQISLSELKTNTGKYVELAEIQDIIITRNGKPAAKLVSAKFDKIAAMESLFGIIPHDVDIDAARSERILK